MEIVSRKLSVLFIMIMALFALSCAIFLYSAVQALGSQYQESTFLFGAAFIVLGIATFTYRVYRYPDRRIPHVEQE